MYLLATICLLGFSSAQKVTELTSCLTKENNLRMDCKFEPTAASTCKYTLGNQVVGSTDSAVTPEPSFKNRANVTIMDSSICRLSLSGLPNNDPQNYTCTVKQQTEAMKTATVKKNLLVRCSALSVLQSSTSVLLLAMMMLPLLLETHWP